jgi:hypothetical protein
VKKDAVLRNDYVTLVEKTVSDRYEVGFLQPESLFRCLW